MKNYKQLFNFAFIAILAFSISFTSCKKDDDVVDDTSETTETTTNKKQMLVIDNGAQNIAPGGNVTYKAHLVDEDGNVSAAKNGVTWTVSESTMATISSGGVISTLGITGTMIVTASVTIDGTTLTATAPLGIYIQPTLFAVAPAAIIGFAGDSYLLSAAYLALSADIPTYAYSSSSDAVATVNSDGVVTLVGGGDCVITVTASNTSFYIPVAVIAEPVIPLPVTKVTLSPASADKFRGETAQFSAKAFNTSGEVAGSQFEWTTSDSNIATIDASGMVSTVGVGEAIIYAKSMGIIGQAGLVVKPDTAILVEPFFAEIGAGGTQQFTATAYNLRTETEITGLDYTWVVPTYGMSIFDIATVNSSGLVTVKSDAMVGMMSMVVAHITGNEEIGGASVMVKLGSIGGCDCGDNVTGVASISVPSTSMTVSIIDGAQPLNAVALDANGNEISGVNFTYCVDSSTIVSVMDGSVLSIGIGGTAVVTICVGDVSTTVNVTATM